MEEESNNDEPALVDEQEQEEPDDRFSVRQPSRSTSIGLPSRIGDIKLEQESMEQATIPSVQHGSNDAPPATKLDAPTHLAMSQAQQDQAAKNRARRGGRAMGAASVTPGVQFVANGKKPPAPSSNTPAALSQKDQDLLAKNRACDGVSSRSNVGAAATTPGVVHVSEPEPDLISPAPLPLSQAQKDQAAKNRARLRSGLGLGAAVVPGAVSMSVANVEPQPSSPPSKVSSAPALSQAQQDQAAKNRSRGGVSGRTMGAAVVPGPVSMSVANVEPQPSSVSPAPALSQAQQDQAAKNRARGGVSGRNMEAVVVPGAVSMIVTNVEPQPSSVSPAPALSQAQHDQAVKNRARGGVSGRTMGAAVVPGAVSATPSQNITNMSQQEQDVLAKQQARAPSIMETLVPDPPHDMSSPLGLEFSKHNMTQAEQDVLNKNRGRRHVTGDTTAVGATTHSAQAYQGGAPPVVPGVVSVSGVKAQELDMALAEQDVLAKNRGRRPVAGGTTTVGATTHSAQAYQGGAPPVVPGVVSVSGEEAQEGDARVRRKEGRAERRENRRAGPPTTGGVIVGAHAYASSEPSVEQVKSQQGGVVHSAHASNSNQAPPANDNAANPLYTSSLAMSGEERQRRIDAKFAQVDRDDAARADKVVEVHSSNSSISQSNSTMTRKDLYPEEPIIQVRETVPVVLQPTTTADRGMAVAPDVEYGEIRQPLVEDQDLAVAIAIEDDEDDNKFLAAAIEYDPDAKPPIYKNRRFRVYMGVGCCILLVAIVIAIVGPTVLGGDEGDVIQQTNAPTSAPSMSPTTSKLGLYGAFFAKEVSELVFTPDTSQDLALQWIMNEDPLQLDINSARILQRYIMVSFYYSTSNNAKSPWRSCGQAVEGEDDSCVLRDFTRNSDDTISYVERPGKTRWLSGTHECDWEGIVCLDGEDILGIQVGG
jgi:hypothetical protein